MTTSSNEPNQQDAILGGDAPVPAQAAVLGGLGPVQERLSSSDLATKFAAMKDCLNHGEAGFAELIPLLEDALPRTQWEAYRLLRTRPEKSVEQALKHYRFWQHFERLDGLPNNHSQMFAHRKVENVYPSLPSQEPLATAYALREGRWSERQPVEEANIDAQLLHLLNSTKADLIEALVIGFWGWGIPVNTVAESLLREHGNLKQLKALFIGDIADGESMISSITQGDLSKLLQTYNELEVVQVRGDSCSWNQKFTDRLRFGELVHNNLIALTIETGGLGQAAISDICNSQLPSLEYLELWMGNEEYGATSAISTLMPIVSGEVLPNLKYLGLRNCDYSDDIAISLALAPARSQLIELDLSMGTLGDTGAKILLESGVLDSLQTLNVSRNYLSDEMVNQLKSLKIQVIADAQDEEDEEEDPQYRRRCSVAE